MSGQLIQKQAVVVEIHAFFLTDDVAVPTWVSMTERIRDWNRSPNSIASFFVKIFF